MHDAGPRDRRVAEHVHRERLMSEVEAPSAPWPEFALRP